MYEFILKYRLPFSSPGTKNNNNTWVCKKKKKYDYLRPIHPFISNIVHMFSLNVYTCETYTIRGTIGQKLRPINIMLYHGKRNIVHVREPRRCTSLYLTSRTWILIPSVIITSTNKLKFSPLFLERVLCTKLISCIVIILSFFFCFLFWCNNTKF